ncbi:MAG TPA: hypothetical protein DHU96_17920 [Actinobacteria bacterium]|nr:hypothetical protein [Actinomycetota bacterium]
MRTIVPVRLACRQVLVLGIGSAPSDSTWRWAVALIWPGSSAAPALGVGSDEFSARETSILS